MLEPRYPIATERLLLRPFEAGDLDALHAVHARPDVVRYLYWAPRSRDELRPILAQRRRQTALNAAGDKLVLAVVRRDLGQVIGDVNLHWLSLEHRQGEIGFVLHPDHQGRGFACEAALVMLRLGFEALGLHRIIGRCDARNAASAKAMERLGMRREAHLRENEMVKGEWCDELVYAMLADEWRTLGAATRSQGHPPP